MIISSTYPDCKSTITHTTITVIFIYSKSSQIMPYSFYWQEYWSSSQPFTPKSVSIFRNTSYSGCFIIINLNISYRFLITRNYNCCITLIFVVSRLYVQSSISIINTGLCLIKSCFCKCTFSKVKSEGSNNTVETYMPRVLL